PKGNQRREGGGALVVGPVTRIGDAHAGVAALYCRNAEARDTGCVACTHVRDLCGNARVARPDSAAWYVAKEADDEREPLFVGHLLFDLSRAHIEWRFGGGFGRVALDRCFRSHGHDLLLP